MILEIMAKDTNDFSWQPTTEAEEIIQNVRTILTTRRGSVPLDRAFGIDTALIDLPVTAIKGRLTTEIIEAVERFEPRVEVKEVKFVGDAADGAVYPVVKVVIL